MAMVCPLFSGSSGNSYYIGTQESGILLDAGKSARMLCTGLQAAGISPTAVQAILLTHEHSDHIAGVRVLAQKQHIPVFATRGTLCGLFAGGVEETAFSYRCVQREESFSVGALRVTAFPTSHDSRESCGYRITFSDGRILTYATDTGSLTEDVKTALRGCDFAILESNHDVEMLRHGPYPYLLKKRILSAQGHLSNADCDAFLPELIKSGTTRVMLAHLSAENNTPELAFTQALRALETAGYRQGTDFHLYVAPKENTAHRVLVF